MSETQHTYKFKVEMPCGGCSRAVSKALQKLEEQEGGKVSYFNVSLEKQEVIVQGTIDYDTVREKIEKTGKKILSGGTEE